MKAVNYELRHLSLTRVYCVCNWLMTCVADAASLPSYGNVGRLLVVILEGVSLKACDDGKTRS